MTVKETKRELHPSVVEFKQFVKSHPKLVEQVRKQQKTWKELYEDWYLFGAEDPMWEAYRSEESEKAEPAAATEEKKDIMGTIVSSLKKHGLESNAKSYHKCKFRYFEYSTSTAAISAI